MNRSSFGMLHLINISEVDKLIIAIKEERQMIQIEQTILSENILEYIANGSRLSIIIKGFRKELEKYIIINILEYTNWNKSRAARILKINYKTLYYKIKKYSFRK